MYRWANQEHTMVLRESDGALIPVAAGNRDYADIAASGAGIAAYQRWANLNAAKAELTLDVERRASVRRFAVAGTSDASKLAAYQVKYETALLALAGDAAALAALAPEATARGETAGDLAALVKSLGDQWRAAGLAIDAAYQTHKAAIGALDALAAAEAYDVDAGWP